MIRAFRLEDSPSDFPLQVLAEDGSGLSGPIPNAKNCTGFRPGTLLT